MRQLVWAEESSVKLRVVATFLPLAQLVEDLAGPWVDVEVLLAEGRSPHDYEPTPSQMIHLKKAHLVVCLNSGFPFDRLWKPLLHAKQPLCQAGSEVELLYDHVCLNKAYKHDKHKSLSVDPHVWFSLRNLEPIAGQIKDDLVLLLPDQQESIQVRYEVLNRKRAALDAEMLQLLQDKGIKNIFVTHPSWGYFARDYGLEQVPIEQFGQAPSAYHLKKYIERLKQETYRVIFVTPEMSPHLALQVAKEADAKCIKVDPLAKDLWQTMKDMLTYLKIMGE